MWVEVEGGKLYVESAGSGTPLLMVHGWPLDHRLFEPQVEGLAGHHRVVTYDRRGFGISQALPDPGLEIGDIARIIDALSLGAVHLLGMSQGARMALRFALKAPQQVRSLLLQGPAIDGFAAPESADERIPVAEYVRLARAGRLDDVKRLWLAHPMMALDEVPAAARALVALIMQDYRGADLLDASRTAFANGVAVLEEVAGFRRPCLLLTGRRETAARRAHAKKLLDTLPDCTEVVMQHSGHLCNLSEPEAYNGHVIEFCARAEASDRLVRPRRS